MSTLKIAVLGAGNIGGTLGRKWVAAGYQVAFGVSDPNGEKARKLRSELGTGAAIGTVAEALSTSPDVVLMAIHCLPPLQLQQRCRVGVENPVRIRCGKTGILDMGHRAPVSIT